MDGGLEGGLGPEMGAFSFLHYPHQVLSHLPPAHAQQVERLSHNQEYRYRDINLLIKHLILNVKTFQLWMIISVHEKWKDIYFLTFSHGRADFCRSGCHLPGILGMSASSWHLAGLGRSRCLQRWVRISTSCRWRQGGARHIEARGWGRGRHRVRGCPVQGPVSRSKPTPRVRQRHQIFIDKKKHFFKFVINQSMSYWFLVKNKKAWGIVRKYNKISSSRTVDFSVTTS